MNSDSKRSRRKRIPLQQLPWGIFNFNLAGPCVAKIYAEASHLHYVIIKVHHHYAVPWPLLSEKSVWCKHCGKGNLCPRRNSGGQMMSIFLRDGLVFPFFLHSLVKIHQQLLQVPIAGGQWEPGPNIQPVAPCWTDTCPSLTLLSLVLGVRDM